MFKRRPLTAWGGGVMGRSVATIDLRRLWEPETPPAPTSHPTTRPDERKACRREVKRSLKALKPDTSARAARTRSWIVSKCGRCMACPKMMAKFGIRPLPHPAQ